MYYYPKINRTISEKNVTMENMFIRFRRRMLYWHIFAITCQIKMLTCQIFKLSCQIFMLSLIHLLEKNLKNVLILVQLLPYR